MNPVVFPYQSRKISDEFSASGWQDGVGASFQERELQDIEKNMRKTELLAEEIAEFMHQTEQLLGE